MKKTTFLFLILIIGFFLLPFTSLNAQVIGIEWNTFMGSGFTDHAYDIAMNNSGNVYITGRSDATWGSPVNAYSGNDDALVVCLDGSGNLLWNTFLGSGGYDYGYSIALDSAGNIYVTGFSDTTWGSPINAHNGLSEVFIACIDNSGNLVWNTFLGSFNNEVGSSITLDSLGNIYVTGWCWATWGSPINSYSGNCDAFVASLDSSGSLLWNTFLGSVDYDYGTGIALNNTGNVYITGRSNATWGSPINTFSGNYDAFVAVLDSSGNLLGNTFLGSANDDYGLGIALDSSGNVYVTGESNATWGSPVNAYSANKDAFVACLNNLGTLQWNTFMGSSSNDCGYGIEPDSSGNVYVTGFSNASWGSPINSYSGHADAFVVSMDSSGNLIWNTFLGSAIGDFGRGIGLDSSRNIYVSGWSGFTWGSPINVFAGTEDTFVAKINLNPISDIKANGSDGPVTITQSDSLQIRISLDTYGLTDIVDYWLAYKGPSGWVHYNNTTKKWETGLGVTHQGVLMELNNKKVFQSSGMIPGNYTFYFGVDMNMDGKVTKSSLYKDEVQVTVTQ